MPDKAHLQPANGADKQKVTAHDNLAQGEGGARKKGPSISEKGGRIPANVPKSKSRSGDNKTPPRDWVAGPKTPDKQGGTSRGHDRTSPTAGKSKSKKHKATRVV